MFLIGLTGGIAAGKSAAMRCLSELGCICFSADEAARAVLIPQGSLLQRIAFRFGDAVFAADGTLDRNRLAGVIFADAGARMDLERIMHPAIINLLLEQVASVEWDFPSDIVVAVEIPLLFESGLEVDFNLTLNIEVPVETQIARLTKRNKLTPEESRGRLEAQLSNEERRKRAAVTVTNNGTLGELSAALFAVLNRLNLSIGSYERYRAINP